VAVVHAGKVPFGGVAVKTAHFLQESADGVKSRERRWGQIENRDRDARGQSCFCRDSRSGPVLTVSTELGPPLASANGGGLWG
jgi:hypothetical protein